MDERYNCQWRRDLKLSWRNIQENKIDKKIRYHHKIVSAEWSTESKSWKLKVHKTDTDEEFFFSCNFLMMCQGYYRHNQGLPELER
ncbi:MAG: hypothetical protein Ct9H90mP2_14300 [Dehalococcoidia bacterium]|nr:MAG: hypothetical protein Ct9H90mP2_14300 [Dehalococcoidia bacterium]